MKITKNRDFHEIYTFPRPGVVCIVVDFDENDQKVVKSSKIAKNRDFRRFLPLFRLKRHEVL